MIEIKAPNRSDIGSYKRVFLAGSINMGSAEKWQDQLVEQFSDELVLFLNPRRDDWDSSWAQDPTEGTDFHEQVTWELDNIEKSDIAVFYFEDGEGSPITLLELGLMIGRNQFSTGDDNVEIVVRCSPEYFRYGNVKIVCDRAGVQVVDDLEALADALYYRIRS